MCGYPANKLYDIDKDQLIAHLTYDLSALRAKLGLSQSEIAHIIGVSRQTYSLIETGKKMMSWNVFLSLILLFGFNEKTFYLLEASGAFSPSLKKALGIDKRVEEALGQIPTVNVSDHQNEMAYK